MDHDRVWTHADLSAFDVLLQPAWVYSCRQKQLLWANTAALRYFNKPTVESFTSTSFSRLTSEEQSAFDTLNHLLVDEVEVCGLEMTVPGFGHSLLPGVPPHAALPSLDFCYKTAISVPPPAANKAAKMVVVKVPKPLANGTNANSSERLMNGASAAAPSSASLVANLLDLFQDIVSGREVALDAIVTLQSSLLRGDIISTPGRIEEELLAKEALDQDVGLNLLQLLGSHTELVLEDDPLFKGSDGMDLNGLQRQMSSIGPADTSATATAWLHSPSSRVANSSFNGNLSERLGSGRLKSFDIDGEAVVASSLMPAMEAVLATVDYWRFDAFKLAEVTQGHPLSALGFWLMKRYDIISHFDLDSTKLARFLRRIEDGYPDNPYHNKTHAAHVLQGMHVLLTRGGLQRRLGEELCTFAGYMAAILHDYEHRGLNNDFLVRVGDELALTYNDMAPMENHHVAASFRLLRNKDFNFMRKMRREKWVRMRRLLIDAVLATDMKQHFNVLSKFQAKLQVKLRGSGFPSSPSHNSTDGPQHDEAQLMPVMEDDADRSLVLQVALKISDVGHLAAPWEVHHRWVTGLEEEFFRQGDKEKTMHMMVSPLMDRTKDGITKSQVGFFDIVALPLFYSWCAVFSNCLPLLRAVEDNCNRWRMMEAERMQHGGGASEPAGHSHSGGSN